jgi:hypothetical protein
MLQLLKENMNNYTMDEYFEYLFAHMPYICKIPDHVKF